MAEKRNISRLVEVDLNLIREKDPELARKVYLIYRRIGELEWKLQEAMENEAEARSELVSVITERESLKKEVKVLRRNLTKLRKQLEEQFERRSQLELEIKDVLLRSEIVQHGFKTLLEKLDELYERLGEKYTREVVEEVRRGLREDLDMLTSAIRKLKEMVPHEVVKVEAKK